MVIFCLNDGCGRVRRAPALVAGLWLATLLVAWPAALVLRAILANDLGSSLAADSAASGVNFDWWNEFLAHAGGIGQTFAPAIIGFAAVLKNLGSIADAEDVPLAVAALLGAYLMVAGFLTGGTIDRLARDRRTGSYGFFAACGTYFFRLLRLAIVAAAAYCVLFAVLHHWMFDTLYPSLTRDLTVERTAFLYRVALYLIFALLLAAVNLLFDYAKIRMVVEDRLSALGTLNAAARFIAHHPARTVALYLLNTLLFVLLIGAYALVVPGAAGGLTAWAALLIGQLYLVMRVALRLLFAASQIAFFQGRLAHAGYAAAPIARWPDSPAADAISPQ
jgi:hypothetical protein